MYISVTSIIFLDLGLPVFLKSARIIFYYAVIIFSFQYFFNYEKSVKYLYNFAALIGGILIFQYFVLFSFDEYVPGYIPILQLERSELIEHGFSTIDKAFRARSVLGEPSEIGIVIGLALFLKTDSMIKKNSILVQDYLLFFYFCFCLLLSRSGTGAGVLIFCLFYLDFGKTSYSFIMSS